jgi:hypothetical protein
VEKSAFALSPYDEALLGRLSVEKWGEKNNKEKEEE